MSIKRKPRYPKRSGAATEKRSENPAAAGPEFEVSYLENPKKAKSTRWQRSYMSLIFGMAFLLISIWYMVSSTK